MAAAVDNKVWSLRRRLALGLAMAALLPAILFSAALLVSQWRRDHHVTLGHDVWIGHGAVVKNSIIMQGCYIGNGADLDYCICDKGVLVADNRRLAGYASYPLYLPRDTRV